MPFLSARRLRPPHRQVAYAGAATTLAAAPPGRRRTAGVRLQAAGLGDLPVRGDLAGLDDRAPVGPVQSLPGASRRRMAACELLELKRFFRDKRWALRVKRTVQELVLQVRNATGPLAQQRGCPRASSRS
jgi:hypothetical protein